MAPKAESGGSGSRSITDFFNRAPALSQTWKELNDSSSTASESDGERRSAAGGTIHVTTPQEVERRDGLQAQAAIVPVSSDPNHAMSPSLPSSLAFRDSPRTNRTVKFPIDDESATAQPDLLAASRQHAKFGINGMAGGDVFAISSSLSPLSSMRDVPSSTSLQSRQRSSAKRVNIQGHEVVRGSDEESDDSLEDLDELFARRKPQYQAEQSPRTSLQAMTNAHERPKVATPPATKETARDRMLKLRQSINAERARQDRMAELNLRLQAKESAAAQEERAGNAKLELSADLLKATTALNGDGEAVDDEQIKKTMDAVKRIEALQQEIVWQFFRPEVPEHPMAAFPSKALPKDPCMIPLKNQDKRDAAFRSGYVARVAKRQALPIEIQHWIFDEICGDYESEDLVMAYIKTLEVACQRFTNHLKPDKLRALFLLIGARDVAVNLGKVEEELQIADSPPRAFSPNVRWLVELIRRLAPTMHKDTAKLTIQLLGRLSLDYSAAKDTALRLLVEETLDALINSFEQNASVSILHEITCTFFNSVKHATLRCRLVDAMPVKTPRAHFFRRHLALSFALDKTPDYGTTFDNLALYSHVILFLENRSELKIRSSTDYTLITAIIKLLDVAIDEGFARPLTTTDPKSPANTHDDKQANIKADFFRPRQPTKSTTTEPEKQFNQSIDLLVSSLEKLRDGIITTGATHISRLEARSAIERLIQRLQFAIRTRRKERKDWFRSVAQVSSVSATKSEQHNADNQLVGGEVMKRNSAIMDVDV